MRIWKSVKHAGIDLLSVCFRGRNQLNANNVILQKKSFRVVFEWTLDTHFAQMCSNHRVLFLIRRE